MVVVEICDLRFEDLFLCVFFGVLCLSVVIDCLISDLRWMVRFGVKLFKFFVRKVLYRFVRLDVMFCCFCFRYWIFFFSVVNVFFL